MATHIEPRPSAPPKADDDPPLATDRPAVLDQVPASIAGPPHALRLGLWSAWALIPLHFVYFAGVLASGAATSAPQVPAWAVAEVAKVAGVVIQVALFAAIHGCAPPWARLYTRMPLGWMLVMATLTATVGLLALIVPALRSPASVDPLLHARWIVDLAVGNPVLLIGGVALWRRPGLGTVGASAAPPPGLPAPPAASRPRHGPR
jgi:hypothetical protein